MHQQYDMSQSLGSIHSQQQGVCPPHKSLSQKSSLRQSLLVTDSGSSATTPISSDVRPSTSSTTKTEKKKLDAKERTRVMGSLFRESRNRHHGQVQAGFRSEASRHASPITSFQRKRSCQRFRAMFARNQRRQNTTSPRQRSHMAVHRSGPTC